MSTGDVLSIDNPYSLTKHNLFGECQIEFIKVVHYVNCDKVLLRVIGDAGSHETEIKLQQRERG